MHATPRVMAVAGVVTVLAGALSAVQSRANGGLTTVVDDSLVVALWSFVTGLVASTVALAGRRQRVGLRALREAVHSGEVTYWACAAGMLGGVFVASQAFSVPHVGVALFTIAIVAGQTGNALVVDALGWGPSGVQRVTWARVVAAAMALVGVAVALGSRVTSSQLGVLPLVGVVVLVGGGTAIQMALNGRVTRACGSAMVTTWLNFATGIVLLLAVAAGRWAAGYPLTVQQWGAPWWMYLGGLMGVVFVMVLAEAVRHLGVLLLLMASLTGQLAMAVTLDVVSPTAGETTWHVVVGVAITLAAAVAAGVASWRVRVETRPQRRSTGEAAPADAKSHGKPQ